ncbi:Wzz/FepE/Etk N-terminal domain-containing protein [Solibacillus sp. FSL W8-0474]|uniref:YveK family protein n=1 Tax=Solibacillus sp. FSL W8-0474 TaxID=2975336 RepID=UPI0030F59BCF
MEESIWLLEIAKIIKKRIWLIITLIVISCVISAGISFYALTPIYQAQTQILVNQKITSEEGYSWQSMDTDLRLINTYNVIITSPAILSSVIEKLNLDVTPAQLTKQISLSNESESKVVNIRVEDTNQTKAVEISNTLAEIFKEQIPQLMSVDNVSILSAATLSDKPIPVKPNKILNIMFGGLIGLMLGTCLVFLLELLDNTIKSESDAETFLNLPVIGIIDVIADEKKKKFSFTSRKVRRT